MLEQAIQDATSVEYSLNFDAGLEDTYDVNVIQHNAREQTEDLKETSRLTRPNNQETGHLGSSTNSTPDTHSRISHETNLR